MEGGGSGHAAVGELIDAQELSERLGGYVSVPTIYRMADRGDIPHIRGQRIGFRKILFRWSRIVDWLEGAEVLPEGMAAAEAGEDAARPISTRSSGLNARD